MIVADFRVTFVDDRIRQSRLLKFAFFDEFLFFCLYLVKQFFGCSFFGYLWNKFSLNGFLKN